MEEEKREFIDFMHPLFDLGLIFGPLFILAGLMALSAGKDAVIVTLIFAGLGGWMLYRALRVRREFSNWIDALEKSGAMADVLSEFRSAVPIADGQTRLGAQHVFPKRGKKMIAYGDILQVYQTVHKLNGFEDSRTVTAVVRAGEEDEETETVRLCSLKLRGKGDDVLREVMLNLLARNPNIKLGYR